MAGRKRKRCPATKPDGERCRARIFPGFEHCIAHEPALKELQHAEGRKAAWVRQGKMGPEPTVDVPKLIADLQEYGQGEDAAALVGFIERGKKW